MNIIRLVSGIIATIAFILVAVDVLFPRAIMDVNATTCFVVGVVALAVYLFSDRRPA